MVASDPFTVVTILTLSILFFIQMLRSTIIRNAALANSRKQAQNMAVRSAFSSVADDTKEEEVRY